MFKYRYNYMNRWIWPLLLVLTIYLASGSSTIAGPDIVNIDKLAHFLIFGLAGILILRCRKPITWTWAIIAFLLISAYGALDEIHQSFTPGRSMEWKDWIADMLGAFISIFLYKTVPLYSTLLERTFPGKTGQAEPVSKGAFNSEVQESEH